MNFLTSAPTTKIELSDFEDGLLVGEAIRRFVFDNENCEFPDKYHPSMLWPIDIDAEKLVLAAHPPFQAIRDGSEQIDMGPAPGSLIIWAAKTADRFRQVIEIFRRGDCRVVDDSNNELHSSMWRRAGVLINLETSDLHEGDRFTILRRNLCIQRVQAPRGKRRSESTSENEESIAPTDAPSERRSARRRPQTEKVITTLCEMGITSKSELDTHFAANSPKELACCLVSKIPGSGKTEHRVGSFTKLLRRIKASDFLIAEK
jgi:hypothetical protein